MNNYFFIMIVLGFCSCQKEISHEVVSTQVDVYRQDLSGDANSPHYEDPIYWKNDSPLQLNFDYEMNAGNIQQ